MLKLPCADEEQSYSSLGNTKLGTVVNFVAKIVSGSKNVIDQCSEVEAMLSFRQKPKSLFDN